MAKRKKGDGMFAVCGDGTIILPDGSKTDLAGYRKYDAEDARERFRQFLPFDVWVKQKNWTPKEIEDARAFVRHLAKVAGVDSAAGKGWLT